MKIKLLKKGYQNNEQIYKDFIDDTIQEENDYFSNETVSIFQTPNFPIYMGRGKETEKRKENFIGVIYDNLDVYNYIIKYALFRNADFVVKFLKIIDDNNWTSIMKSQIKDRPDLGADERYGRRVGIRTFQ